MDVIFNSRGRGFTPAGRFSENIEKKADLKANTDQNASQNIEGRKTLSSNLQEIKSHFNSLLA